MANPPPERTPPQERESTDGLGQLSSSEERAVVLEHLREGWTVSQICRMLFGHPNGKVLMRQWVRDPDFHRECIDAMRSHFGPTLDKAVTLSLSADVAGKNEGAHKAMALVLNYYSKVMDRRTKSIQGEQEAASAKERASIAAAAAVDVGPALVLGPEGVKELLGHLPQRDDDNVLDVPAKLVERTDT